MTEKQILTLRGWTDLHQDIRSGAWYGLKHVTDGAGFYLLGKDLMGQKPLFDVFQLHEWQKALAELAAIKAQQMRIVGEVSE